MKLLKKKAEPVPQKERSFPKGTWLRPWCKHLLFACFLLGAGLFFVYIGTHRVSGDSMAPTFATNDRVFIHKKKQPERYDIVTFIGSDEPKESYIKRVVGMPGDAIWLEENKLFINHQLPQAVPIPSNTDKRAIDLPDGTLKINVTVGVEQQLSGLTTIPAGHYFVLGDNRNHSKDSRWWGLIQEEQLEGVVTFRYYPFTRLGSVR